ncbi:MAG: hypothetical protein NT154_33090 [Verrucomicrobia bacterium]|nr:hypothetical protein [Verrucomicrobiota bacterium]
MRNRCDNDSRAKGLQDWGGIRAVLMRRLWTGLLMLAGLVPCPLQAQINAVKASAPDERCLLIVETSKSMQRRSSAVLGAVQELLGSRLNGEFRGGGTIGVWTFNQDLFAGRLPVQKWPSTAQHDVIERTLAFLKGLKYEKLANFEKVAPALGRVIQDSEFITVILISSGDSRVQGTPFDARINETYQRWYERQQKARAPFVTILRARHGQVADYVVNTPPWPMQVPRLPPETKIAEAKQTKPPESVAKPQPRIAPPLIITGRKPQPEPPSVLTPEPMVTDRAAPPPVATVAATNVPATLNPAVPSASPVQVARAELVSAVPEQPAKKPQPETAPPATTVKGPGTEDVKASLAKPADPASVKPEATTPPAALEPKHETTVIDQKKPAPLPEAKTEAVPVPAVSREPAPAATESATAAQPEPSGPVALKPSAPSRPTSPAQSATAVPAESLLRSGNIWIVGLLFAIVALGGTLLLLRRLCAAPHASLITRSFDRKKKL